MQGRKRKPKSNREVSIIAPRLTAKTAVKASGGISRSKSITAVRNQANVEDFSHKGTLLSGSSTSYRMSFSTGGLFVTESVALAKLYKAKLDWEEVKDFANDQKVLGFRTQSSSKRTVRELIARLQKLSNAELELLSEANKEEQALLLWLAVCRTYLFVAQFAIEVLQEHFLSLRMAVAHDDFYKFYEVKAEWNDALAQISPSTRAKLRQVLFRMMRESGILSKDGTLHPIFLPPAIKISIASHDPDGLSYFPGPKTDRGVR